VIYERVVGGTQSDLYSINVDGSDFRPVAYDSGFSERLMGMTANGRVIYEARSLDGSQTDLYSVNADGTGRALLVASAGGAKFAGVTATGRVIFVRFGGTTLADLYSINADGSAPATLAASQDHEEFAGVTPGGRVIYTRELPRVGGGTQSDLYSVTPGERVIFQRLVGGTQRDLYSINANGSGGATALATSSTRNEFFSWITPTGRVLYSVEPVGGGQRDVYSINADGSGGPVPLASTSDWEEVAHSYMPP
jgi:hypothetical protein